MKKHWSNLLKNNHNWALLYMQLWEVCFFIQWTECNVPLHSEIYLLQIWNETKCGTSCTFPYKFYTFVLFNIAVTNQLSLHNLQSTLYVFKCFPFIP
jgi:hypothetical protein